MRCGINAALLTLIKLFAALLYTRTTLYAPGAASNVFCAILVAVPIFVHASVRTCLVVISLGFERRAGSRVGTPDPAIFKFISARVNAFPPFLALGPASYNLSAGKLAILLSRFAGFRARHLRGIFWFFTTERRNIEYHKNDYRY